MLSKWLWTRATVKVVRRSNALQKHIPPSDQDHVEPIPIERRYPGLAGTPLAVSAATPLSERPGWAQRHMLQLILGLKEHIGLSASYQQPFTDQQTPYPKEFAGLAPAPTMPEDFALGADRLAGIALRGPFSTITRRAGTGFELDLRHIEALTPRKPFLKGGGLARFSRVAPDKLRTDSVELGGQRFTPGSEGYELAEKRFLAGVNSHMTFIEHLINCHMITAGSFVMATYETLLTRHPLRAWLQPFVVETMRVNNDNIDGLIKSEASNVPSYTGYPLAVLNNVVRDVARGFDLRNMDPEVRARTQGTLDEPGFVTVMSRVEVFRIFRDMTARFCRDVLKKVDDETRAWCQAVDKYVPNGARALLGLEDWSALTLDQVAHLVAVCTLTSSVTHYLVAETVRDYMMQFHIMPPAVAEDGYPQVGMVLEKMNSITIAGILRYKLLDDAVFMPDATAATIWGDFQSALRAYHAKVEAEPALRRYRIELDRVPSSIHA